MAIEELNKTNREKQSLLSKIKKFEAEKHAGSGKGNHIMAFAFVPHATYLVNCRFMHVFVISSLMLSSILLLKDDSLHFDITFTLYLLHLHFLFLYLNN